MINLLSKKIHYDIKQLHVRSTGPSELDKEDLGNVQQHVGFSSPSKSTQIDLSEFGVHVPSPVHVAFPPFYLVL